MFVFARALLSILLVASGAVFAGSEVLRVGAQLPEMEARGSWQNSLDELNALGTPVSWLLIGPIPDKEFKQFSLPNGMAPDTSDDWTGQNTRVWNRPRVEDGCFLDLREALDARTELLAYARAEIEWPVDGPALLWFDTFGRAIVYLNNTKVITATHKSEVPASADTMYPVIVQMKRGINILKVKVGQDRKPKFKDCGFFCRVERHDTEYLKARTEKLCQLYPDEAAGWRGAEAWLAIARRHELEGRGEPALALYKKVLESHGADGEYRLEAEAGIKRIEARAQPLASEEIWKQWKATDEKFKALMRNAETAAADNLMRNYIASFALHESAGNALIFRGGLREDYNFAQSCQRFYERALREHSQNEFVRKFALRGMDFVRNTRTERPQVRVQQEFQLAIDAARRQITGGNEDDIAAAIRTLLDALAKSPGQILEIADSPFFPRYAGLREYIRALLAHLGGKPLNLYREIVERDSTTRLREARAAGDDAALGAVAAEFPYTRAAALALNQLGNRYMDRGEWTQALQVFRVLEREYSRSGVSEATIVSKIAAILVRMGQTAAAEEVLDRLAREFAKSPITFAGENANGDAVAAHLRKHLKNVEPEANTAGRVSATLLANIQRTGAAPGSPSPAPRAILWSVAAPQSQSSFLARDFWPEDTVYSHLQPFPVISGDRVFVSTFENIQALDLNSGKTIWKHSWDSRGSLFPQVDGRTLFTGFPQSCPTVDNGKVYLRTLRESQSALRCYAAADGRLLWSTESSAALKRMVFLSDPLITNGCAIAVFLEPPDQDSQLGQTSVNTHGVIAFDAATGQLRWKTALATGAMGRVVERIVGRDSKQYATYRASMQLGAPSADAGVVYTPTGLGSMAALSVFTGELIWLSGYPQLRSESLENGNSSIDRFLPRVLKYISRGPAAPLVGADVVLLAPKDATGLIAFERQSGMIRWMQELNDSRFIAGVCAGNVLVCDNTVKAISLATGATAWEFSMPDPKRGLFAQPGFSGSTLYLPTADVLLMVDARTGKSTGSMPWSAQPGALGNLVVSGSMLVGVNGKFIGAVGEKK